VIGRVFLYEILKRITELKKDINRCLRGLEQLDLIRTRSLLPELEYVFKHALTQEVAYSGLLKKHRREIHEQIALVMEKLFYERLPEFYETLSFHFKQGRSIYKAADYLIKSGEKCLGRYSLEEAHQYYRQAFDILTAKVDKSKEKVVTLIDLLNSWAYVYYYLGDFNELTKLLESNQDLAESLNDERRLGMFYVWLGVTYYMSGRIKESYELLQRAKDLGEKCDNLKVVGYACTWLTWTCSELGLFDEGIGYGERAKHIAKSFPADQYLFFKSLAGLGHISTWRGNIRNVFKTGELLLEYGKRKANNRSEVMGHYLMCASHSLNGDYQSSITCGRKAVEVSKDPSYSQFPKAFLIYAHLMNGNFGEARAIIKDLIAYCEQHGFSLLLPWANLFLGAALIGDGNMTKGLRMIKKARHAIIEDQRNLALATSEFLLAEVFSQISTGPSPNLSVIVKNIVFLVKHVPFASKKAEKHFNNAITISKKINTPGLTGPAYYYLGLFYKKRKRIDKAIECISNATRIFEKCGAEAYLKQAKEDLISLR
jgi:tetratricopeptide (TPR) repeat protein